jgi:hypothetical protein
MKERKRLLSSNNRFNNVISEQVTPTTKSRHRANVSRQQSAVRSRKPPIVVFCGDAEQVSVGFALALDLMESHADLLTMSPEPAPHKH